MPEAANIVMPLEVPAVYFREVRTVVEDTELDALLRRARELSWKNLGRKITFYLPGMIRYGRAKGRFPAISVTGDACGLSCEHCRGEVLKPMIPATTPEDLVRTCLLLEEQGNIGCLLSGGGNGRGAIPWDRFVGAIAEVKRRTRLRVSLHTGVIDLATARRLKEAGVDQALIDAVGCDETLKQVYHLDGGIRIIDESMQALELAGLPLIPHIVVGLHYGEIKGEIAALEMVSRHNPETLVFVVLTPLPGTPMERITPPSPEKVAELLAQARLRLPHVPMALGCERPRNRNGIRMGVYAVDAGVNRIAVQSEQAVQRAESYDLEIYFQQTCCSVGLYEDSGALRA